MEMQSEVKSKIESWIGDDGETINAMTEEQAEDLLAWLEKVEFDVESDMDLLKGYLDFKEALKHMNSFDPLVDWARDVIFSAVEPLCKTDIMDELGQPTLLGDWLSAGDYSGDETPESIAVEWDALENN